MKKVVVIGGGPAGMMAAIFAAKENNQVFLIEKNEKLGKKLYITGKGRCNLTNDCTPQEFLENVVSNPKFLYGAINVFPPEKTMSFFEENGLILKTERGKRVFPFSDKSSDVLRCLEKVNKQLGVNVLLNTCVKEIVSENGVIVGVKTDKEFIECNSVIVCTGGLSYSSTGSTGDGYSFAKEFNHTIIQPKQSLVGIELKGDFYKSLMGLSLKNVSFRIENKDNGKIIFSEQGEMLFTHFGVSGPIVLTASCLINRLNLENLTAYIDFKPALEYNTLDNRLLREFEENNTKSIAAVMRSLLPQSLIEEVLLRAQIGKTRKCSEIKQEQRANLIKTLKNFELKPKKLRPIEEAIVTAGGVSTKEINPKTMESKYIKGLFFAGEVIDVDAFTGGFNIQIALSTGYLAGKNA
jgi:predicted Rossmann fold flavoprotein